MLLRISTVAAYLRWYNLPLTCKGEACNVDAQQHGHRDTQLLPCGGIVPRPDGANPLAARKEGSAQHKRPVSI